MKNRVVLVAGVISLLTGIGFTIESLPIIDRSGHSTKAIPPKEKPSPGLDIKQVVKVGLMTGVSNVTLTSASGFTFQDLLSSEKKKLKPKTLKISAKGNQILIDGKPYPNKIWLEPGSSENFINVMNTKVRGRIKIRAHDDSHLTVINELNLDSYLKGVLPREVIVSWPMEALKTQAVASRTYLISHLGRHSKEGFDVCNKVHCQVYGGMNKENKNTNQAVDQTRGKILTFEGKPIGTFFHANCGGSTEKIKAVWGSPDKPYLPAKKCGYGKAAPWFKWKRDIPDDYILTSLRNDSLVKGNKLKKISVKKKSQSRRAEVIDIQTEKGTYTMSGNSFRMALHPEKIRSTLWTNLRKTSSGYHFEGQGWGHGVGMCQWGAKGLSEKGRNFKSILSFYYPHTKLTDWKR